MIPVWVIALLAALGAVWLALPLHIGMTGICLLLLAAVLLAAVEEDAPQPVSTPAHRASAAAAAVTRCQFLLVALRIV